MWGEGCGQQGQARSSPPLVPVPGPTGGCLGEGINPSLPSTCSVAAPSPPALAQPLILGTEKTGCHSWEQSPGVSAPQLQCSLAWGNTCAPLPWCHPRVAVGTGVLGLCARLCCSVTS